MTSIFDHVSRIARTLGAGSLLMVLAAGCTRTDPTASGPSPKAAQAEIKTDRPKNLRRAIEQPATIEAFEETPLVAHIAGYVERDPADIGKVIVGPKYDAKGTLTKPGEVLATLAVPELLRELEQKTALVKQAKAEVDQASASLDAAEAAILTAKAQIREAESSRARAAANHDYWKGQHARIDEIVRTQVLDKQIRDETLNKYKAAEAFRDEIEAKVQSVLASTKESEARRNKAKADVEAAKARVLVAQAEEGRLAALVEYRFIRAPFDGVVTRRNVHTGHFLQPGAGSGANVVFVVARTDILRIVAEIPEADAGYITNGMVARIEPPMLMGEAFEAKIARTSWTLNSKSRTLRIEIDHANKAAKLRPGMYVNLSFTIAFDNRWVLPAGAIFMDADQPCCWRVEEGKAVRTPLKLGGRDGQSVEVLKMQKRDASWEAITGKEEIVISGRGAVTEGMQIPVK